MNEREIFAAALEQPTDAQRQAFLDDLPDPAMRDRIGRLLEKRSQLGSFLEHPPVEFADAELGATVLQGGSTCDDAAQLGRRRRILRVAEPQGRQAISTADGGRMGMGRPGRKS